MRTAVLGLMATFSVALSADARPVCDKPATHAPNHCKRTKYRYIGEERVPWGHDEDDHDWDEFEHTTDECEPPPC